MKKLHVALILLTSTIAMPTYPLSPKRVTTFLITCAAIPTTGLAYKLYQDTSNNITKELYKAVATCAGFGSQIRQIRFNVQDFISKNINTSSSHVKNTLRIEKAAYITGGVIYAIISFWGLSTLLSD